MAANTTKNIPPHTHVDIYVLLCYMTGNYNHVYSALDGALILFNLTEVQFNGQYSLIVL